MMGRMDINLLVLNVGNSRLAIGILDGKLEFSTRVPHEHRAAWPGKIADAWSRVNASGDAAVAGANVNPAMIESLEHVVERATGKKIEWVGSDLDVPIPVLTEQPAETGIDRVLNVAAAYERMQKACVVVDAGTALTMDVCNDRGEFLGGAIAPGSGMMLDALHERTAKLPACSWKRRWNRSAAIRSRRSCRACSRVSAGWSRNWSKATPPSWAPGPT